MGTSVLRCDAKHFKNTDTEKQKDRGDVGRFGTESVNSIKHNRAIQKNSDLQW